MLTRARVLSYRVAVHHLERPTGEGVLPAGVQDSPPGYTANHALRVRELSADAAELVLAQSVRAAAHLHRAKDIATFTAALGALQITDLAKEHFGPFDPKADLPGAMAHVALAMRQVFADGEPRTKGELSTALTDLVDPRLTLWCRTCNAHHVQDALFRYATLQAELIMQVDPRGFYFHYAPMPYRGTAPPPDPEASQTALARRFLRLCGPSRPEHLARWLALRPGATRRIWKRLADTLVPVTVDGREAWMHPEDLDDLLATPPAAGVQLLPPYDPITELADRHFLLPDREQRVAVWRPAGRPGILLIRGEIAGTWRERTTARQLTVTIKPFSSITPADRRAAARHAKTLTERSDLSVRARFEVA